MKGTNPSLLPSSEKWCLLIPNSPDRLVKSLKHLCSFHSPSLYLLCSYSFSLFPSFLLLPPIPFSFSHPHPLFSCSLWFICSFPTFRTSKFLQLYHLVTLKGCMDLCLFQSHPFLFHTFFLSCFCFLSIHPSADEFIQIWSPA